MPRLLGSLNNRLMEHAAPIVPTVGMGATIIMYTDRHACTIVDVRRHGANAQGSYSVVVQHDRATRTDTHGMSDSQAYTYAPDPLGMMEIYTQRKNGKYVRKGEGMDSGTVLVLGVRDSHYDYSF